MSHPRHWTARTRFFTKMAFAGMFGLAAVIVQDGTHDDSLVRVACFILLLLVATTIACWAILQYDVFGHHPSSPTRQDLVDRDTYALGDNVKRFPPGKPDADEGADWNAYSPPSPA